MRTDRCVVVTDAGPIIHLHELDCLDLLGDFAPLVAPETVWAEVQKHRPMLRVEQIPSLRVEALTKRPSDELAVFVETLNLGAGETAALTLAEHASARLFLTDDSAARFAGESRGLRVHGTIGVLLRSIRQGRRTREFIVELLRTIRRRSSLYLSDRLIAEVVDMVESR